MRTLFLRYLNRSLKETKGGLKEHLRSVKMFDV